MGAKFSVWRYRGGGSQERERIAKALPFDRAVIELLSNLKLELSKPVSDEEIDISQAPTIHLVEEKSGANPSGFVAVISGQKTPFVLGGDAHFMSTMLGFILAMPMALTINNQENND